MNVKFLTGVVVGMALMFALLFTMAAYQNFNTRLSYVEGYIQQLDTFIRTQQ